VLPLARVQELSNRILDEVERAVVGKRDELELVLLGLLADGHVLLEDYPARSSPTCSSPTRSTGRRRRHRRHCSRRCRSGR
jgi:hypothetical protein